MELKTYNIEEHKLTIHKENWAEIRAHFKLNWGSNFDGLLATGKSSITIHIVHDEDKRAISWEGNLYPDSTSWGEYKSIHAEEFI